MTEAQIFTIMLQSILKDMRKIEYNYQRWTGQVHYFINKQNKPNVIVDYSNAF